LEEEKQLNLANANFFLVGFFLLFALRQSNHFPFLLFLVNELLLSADKDPAFQEYL
jgi:hypothetical protein